MPQVRDILNQIWSIFRGAGIADDLTIILHAAHILVENQTQQSGIASSGYQVVGLEQHEQERVVALLQQASESAGGAANLLNRHLLFRLSTMLAGGRYPTPRHVVAHMVALASVQSTNRVADFACGSGGFLVQAAANSDSLNILGWGVELSPEWAEIAKANLLLHDLSNSGIEVGNALRVSGNNGTLHNETFDRILMNPPFGERVDSASVADALPSDLAHGGRSETALLALALHKLRSDGCAAILAPTGLLFSNSVAESTLRRIVVDDFHLEALITLPDDAFQPYSQLQTHLLLLNKPTALDEHANSDTWFFRAQDDGYSAGRSRDLTKEPKASNDLTHIEGAIEWWRSPEREELWYQKNGISVAKEVNSKEVSWFIVETERSQTIERIELYPLKDSVTPFLIVSTNDVQEGQNIRLRLSLDGKGKPMQITDLEQALRKLYKLKKSDSLPVPVVLHQDFSINTALILGTGRLLGVAVPKPEIKNRNYELRPDSYIIEPAETAILRPPLELLTDIQDNSQQLQRRLDKLVDYLEPTRHQGAALISPVIHDESGAAIGPVGILNQAQSEIWQRIQAQVIESTDSATAPMPKPFQPKDIDSVGDSTQVSNETLATIELAEKMGLVVPIHYAVPDANNPTPFYRLTAENDLWDGVDSESDNEDEGTTA